jgi:hypothetical protein
MSGATAKPRLDGAADDWLHYFVRVPLGPDASSDAYRVGVLVLRQLEGWLADHHRPHQLFDRHGRPKTTLVSVFFSENERQTALAYRIFCNELGLSHGLQQSRVRHNRCPRTTPAA